MTSKAEAEKPRRQAIANAKASSAPERYADLGHLTGNVAFLEPRLNRSAVMYQRRFRRALPAPSLPAHRS